MHTMYYDVKRLIQPTTAAEALLDMDYLGGADSSVHGSNAASRSWTICICASAAAAVGAGLCIPMWKQM